MLTVTVRLFIASSDVSFDARLAVRNFLQTINSFFFFLVPSPKHPP